MDNNQNPKGTSNEEWEKLGATIEAEVREAVGNLGTIVSGALQTAAGSVQKTFSENQPLQNAVNGFATQMTGWQKKSKKKKSLYVQCSKKAAAATAEASGLLLPCGILAVIAFFIASPLPTGILAVISFWFAVRAVTQGARARRLRRLTHYLNVLGERTNAPVAQIASAVGKSESYVSADLNKMIADVLLEGMYLTPDGRRLFASETAYRLHLAQEEQRKAQQAAAPKATAKAAPEPARESSVLEECRSFAAELRRQGELIDEASVNEQVNDLATHTARITTWLEKHPTQEHRVKRFTSYYLPTTIKLLNVYNTLDNHAVEGSVAAESQTEIAGILSTINAAFQNLEDGLIADVAMDVSAEISALETVLAQDGLTEEEMHFHG